MAPSLDAGAERAGFHQEGAKAQRFDLLPERLRYALDCELAGGVGPVDWQTGNAVHRGDIDDGALLPAAHAREDEAH